MDQITPREAILGSGAGGPLTAPTPWIVYAGYLNYPYAVTIGTPTGGQQGPGTLNLSKIYLNGVLVDLTKYVLWTGGALTGILTLSGPPVNPLDAATKQYVDNSITTVNGTFANYLPLVGGTLTGFLTLSADPTAVHHAATKSYVDSKIGFSFGDAPNDGNPYARKSVAWAESDQIDVGTY